MADVFGALTPDRPYHAKVTCERAEEMMAKDSGTRFDPAVVGAFQETPRSEWIELEQSVAARAR